MEARDLSGRLDPVELGLAPFELQQPTVRGGREDAILDGVHQGLDLALDINPFAAGHLIGKLGVAAAPVELGMELGDELLHEIGREQLVLEARQNAFFERVAADHESILAGTAIAAAGAAVTVMAN